MVWSIKVYYAWMRIILIQTIFVHATLCPFPYQTGEITDLEGKREIVELVKHLDKAISLRNDPDLNNRLQIILEGRQHEVVNWGTDFSRYGRSMTKSYILQDDSDIIHDVTHLRIKLHTREHVSLAQVADIYDYNLYEKCIVKHLSYFSPYSYQTMRQGWEFLKMGVMVGGGAWLLEHTYNSISSL